MPWTPLDFGRYKGKTLPQVLFTDPDYFFWARENSVFDKYGRQMKSEAERIHAKATSIRIPKTGSERLRVEYKFYYSNHTSVGFDIVEESRPPHQGSTPTQRADFIDMSIPRRQRDYDKLGYRIFLGSLKHCLFGNESARMSRQRSEAFFDDDSNFHRNG
jgi:hypothetical protein